MTDDLDVFNDSPTVGLGPDGLAHDDPYCAAIAPLGTPEARRGELCNLCVQRQNHNHHTGHDINGECHACADQYEADNAV